jgi:hypothetical protein
VGGGKSFSASRLASETPAGSAADVGKVKKYRRNDQQNGNKPLENQKIRD